ncbi:cc25b1bc-5976-4992-9d6c-7d8b4de0e9d1 [Thermothielavioides terrestris]|uniref:Cc25b1bc-5976-4992-9d6c-7d8b4de0e9d1 n=1 Tax=Thermothielavioides terrestris TaxID=2587410 RepID=A0A446BVG1_9PEZI|nr:cc25b1bc-5976-4992-9d6c-7d8b4de0e9d1 [Thermothielavioides terrestris]
MAHAAAPPSLRRRQRQAAYQFEQYREWGAGVRNVDCTTQQALAYQALIPRQGAYPGLTHPNPGSAPELEELDDEAVMPPTPRDRPAAKRKLKLQLSHRRLRFEKWLGWGGNGLASLFYLDSATQRVPRRGRRTYFVVKSCLRPDANSTAALQREDMITDMFRGLKHFVQLKTFPNAEQPRRSARLGGQANLQPSQTRTNDIMLLEYLPRGSLHKALCGASANNLTFQTRLLWEIFHCLVQSTIAMAYPPPQYPALYPGGLNAAAPVMEVFPPGNIPTPSRFVHFDIDPSNVLVGGNDPTVDPDHPVAPVMKLSDFGISNEVTDAVRADGEQALHFRRLAKHRFFTPEQFTKEWDWVPLGRHPYAGAPWPTTVAGQWGWASNLFQVGLAMACLITQCYPPCPPVPGLIWIFHPEYVIGDAEDEEEDDRPKHPPVHAGQVAGKTDRNNVSKYLAVWSYGEYLLHENVPWEKDENRYLLEQVAECLTFDLTRWYEKTHLPEVLATGGVRRAGLYALVDVIAPDGGDEDGDGDELASNLVLTYLGAKEVEGKDVEGLLRPSWLTLGAAGRVRSTLLIVDATRPGPPSVRGTKSEDQSDLEASEERYLCLHEVSDAEINMSEANGLKILKYALLHAS